MTRIPHHPQAPPRWAVPACLLAACWPPPVVESPGDDRVKVAELLRTLSDRLATDGATRRPWPRSGRPRCA
jgi:hypothetical protein